ncbi:MAG TPA: hypothetical protein VF144_05795 [Chitinophagaceae bacterium]
MKKNLVLLLLLGVLTEANSCPACENQQPEILRGITHGAGPQSNWDYLIISVAAVIVVATLYFSVKWLLSPGEKDENHIKRVVLNYE